MLPFIGPRARADVYPPWHDVRGCQYNFPDFGNTAPYLRESRLTFRGSGPNFGISAPYFGGHGPAFQGRGAGGPLGGRFSPPHGPRWPLMFGGGPPFPSAGEMPRRPPPFRPVKSAVSCSTERFSRHPAGSWAPSGRGDGDNSHDKRPQHAGANYRWKSSRGTERTSSESLLYVENRRWPPNMYEKEAQRKKHDPRKRVTSNEYRRPRSRSPRPSTSSRDNRARGRHRSQEHKYAMKSRDVWRGRNRARTRSRSPDEPRRRKRGEYRTGVGVLSRCTTDTHAEHRRSTRHTEKKCLSPQSRRSAVVERNAGDCKYAMASRNVWKGRKRARTRSRSPDGLRGRKRGDSRSRTGGYVPSRCRTDAHAERKKRTYTQRTCIYSHPRLSAAAEPPAGEYKYALTSRDIRTGRERARVRSRSPDGYSRRKRPDSRTTADGEGNASYSVTASGKKHVPRKDDFNHSKSALSKREVMPVTRQLTFPSVSSGTAKSSHLGSRSYSDEEQCGPGAQLSCEDGDNLVERLVLPFIEDYHQTAFSQLQPGGVIPDSNVNLLQFGHASMKQLSEVMSGGECEKKKLAVTCGGELALCTAVRSNGEDVDPEATSFENTVGKESSMGPTESVVRSAFPAGFTSPPRHLGQHICREREQIEGMDKHLNCSSTADDKCVNVEGETESSTTFTPAHCSTDSAGEILPGELLSLLRQAEPGTIEWFKSLKAQNSASNVLKGSCERQDQPADFGVTTQASTYTDLQMPSASAATYVDLEAPSTSPAAYFSAGVDRDKETESIASTPDPDYDLFQLSPSSETPGELAPQEDCYMPRTQGLSATTGICVASGECLRPAIGPRLDTTAFPALASVREQVLYEKDAHTAFLILDLLRDAQRKSRVRSLYEEGWQLDRRAACSAEIRRLVLEGITSQPASRRSLARILRKLANFQWTT